MGSNLTTRLREGNITLGAGRKWEGLARVTLALSLVAVGCGSVDDIWPLLTEQKPLPEHAKPRRGPTEEIFSRDHMLEVNLTLDEADWDSLRYEGKSQFDTWPASEADLAPYEYTTFPARARVDGKVYSEVGLRKSAFLGGLTALKPELEIDFAFGHRLRSGLRTLTLSNDLEDPTLIRECLAFDLFADAGYPAPRCNWARVSVNGQELGTYVHVEAINEQFLARHFDDASGNLYRADLADVFDNTLPLIRNVNHPPRQDRSDLLALHDALELEGEAFVPALAEVLDLEAFRDFWALETLLGHWDGYSNSANNYYLYKNPETERFVFLPWDTDQAFVGAIPWRPPYEITVYYAGRVAGQLYANEEQRGLFRKRLGELNDNLWDGEDLVARAEAMAAGLPSDETALQAHLDYLRTHGTELRAALLQPAPEVQPPQPFAPPPGDECQFLLTPISGTFTTRLSAGPYVTGAYRGSATLDASPDGQQLNGEAFSFAGPNPIVPGSQSIFIGTEHADGYFAGFTLLLPEAFYSPGEHPFHAWETFAPAIVMNPFDEASIATYGYVADGSVILEAAGTELGDAVAGRFSGNLYQLGCLPTPLTEP